MTLSRRSFLQASAIGGAAAAIAPNAFAKSGPPPWHAGYATAPAAGFAPAPMRLVTGKAPKGLAGSLYRNGPAQFGYGSTYASHWFDGDGMVHRIAIGEGNAVHSGKFVQTPKRKAEQAAQRFLAAGFGTAGDPSYAIESPDDTNAANTSVIMAGGDLLGLWEAGSAYRLDPATLETRGVKTWRPDLAGMPFLAHPKREPDGRIWNLGVSGSMVGIYRISPAGDLEDFQVVDIGVAPYIHDWTMTERSLVIVVQPWLMTTSRPPFVNSFDWKPESGLRMLVIDKDDLSKRRWAQAPARAFFHTGTAWEEADGTIRFDASLYKEPVLGMGGGAELIAGNSNGIESPAADLTQVVIPPTGDARLIETGVESEFPQNDPRRVGRAGSLTLAVSGGAKGRPGQTGLVLHDWKSGRTDQFDLGARHMVEEHLFVPKPGGATERDCWLVGTALNIHEQATEFSVYDAARLSDGPLAVWRAAYSWPLGFHGTWAG